MWDTFKLLKLHCYDLTDKLRLHDKENKENLVQQVVAVSYTIQAFGVCVCGGEES